MSSLFTESREDLHLGVRQVLLEEVNADFSLCLRRDLIHVKVDYMRGNLFVQILESVISDDEDSIET